MTRGSWRNCPASAAHLSTPIGEAGDDHFHKFLGEFGDRGRACGGRLLHISTERPSDYGFGSVPDSVNEEFTRYYDVSKTQFLNGI